MKFTLTCMVNIYIVRLMKDIERPLVLRNFKLNFIYRYTKFYIIYYNKSSFKVKVFIYLVEEFFYKSVTIVSRGRFDSLF